MSLSSRNGGRFSGSQMLELSQRNHRRSNTEPEPGQYHSNVRRTSFRGLQLVCELSTLYAFVVQGLPISHTLCNEYTTDNAKRKPKILILQIDMMCRRRCACSCRSLTRRQQKDAAAGGPGKQLRVTPTTPLELSPC